MVLNKGYLSALDLFISVLNPKMKTKMKKIM